MIINPISNGIVIDHITAGKGMTLYNILNLAQLDCSVAIIKTRTALKWAKRTSSKSTGSSI